MTILTDYFRRLYASDNVYETSVVSKFTYNSSISPNTRQILYVFAAALIFFFIGANRALLIFLFYRLENSTTIPEIHYSEEPCFAVCYILVSPLGSLLAGFCMDLFGRRRGLQIAYLPVIVSWTIIMFSTDVAQLQMAFLVQGLGTGMCYCAGIYVAEISIPKYRGGLFTIPQLCYNFGILFNNYFTHFLPLKVASLVLIVMAVGAVILNNLLPESPVWLCLKGDTRKSVESLCSLRGSNADELTAEIQELENYCSFNSNVSFKDIVRSCFRAKKQIRIVIFLSISATGCGYMLIELFILTIFKRLRITGEVRALALTYLFVGVATSFMMPYFMYKAKRKTVLGLSSMGMGISLMCVAIFLRFKVHLNSWIFAVAFCVYSFCANMGFVPLVITAPGEILPSYSKGILTGFCGGVGFLYLFIVQGVLVLCWKSFGAEILIWSFIVFCFLLTLFAIYYFPETKGKTLCEIQEEYFKTDGEAA